MIMWSGPLQSEGLWITNICHAVTLLALTVLWSNKQLPNAHGYLPYAENLNQVPSKVLLQNSKGAVGKNAVGDFMNLSIAIFDLCLWFLGVGIWQSQRTWLKDECGCVGDGWWPKSHSTHAGKLLDEVTSFGRLLLAISYPLTHSQSLPPTLDSSHALSSPKATADPRAAASLTHTWVNFEGYLHCNGVSVVQQLHMFSVSDNILFQTLMWHSEYWSGVGMHWSSNTSGISEVVYELFSLMLLIDNLLRRMSYSCTLSLHFTQHYPWKYYPQFEVFNRKLLQNRYQFRNSILT